MISIIGPTASGKTSLATHLAEHFIRSGIASEIISGDSRQVYSGMDLGTGKDLDEFNLSVSIPYHLINICNPGEKYNIFKYQQDFMNVYNDCLTREVLPILCGGSGLYIETVLKGYHLSPVPLNTNLRKSLADKSLDELTVLLKKLKERNGTIMHNSSDVDTAKRAIRAIEIETYNAEHPIPNREMPAIDSIIIGIDIDRELRREKITARLKQRLDEGMVDEIRNLLQVVTAEDLIYYGLEYKYVTEYVIGKLTYDEMFSKLEIAIHQFAKRQMTWFRGMERRGFTINWIDATLPMEETIERVLKVIEEQKIY